MHQWLSVAAAAAPCARLACSGPAMRVSKRLPCVISGQWHAATQALAACMPLCMHCKHPSLLRPALPRPPAAPARRTTCSPLCMHPLHHPARHTRSRPARPAPPGALPAALRPCPSASTHYISISCLSSHRPAAPCPPRRVLVPLTPGKPCVTKGKFTLLSYNLLADLYATVSAFVCHSCG